MRPISTPFFRKAIVLFYFIVIFCVQQTKHKKTDIFLLQNLCSFVQYRLLSLENTNSQDVLIFKTRENANHFSYLPSWAKKHRVFAWEGCSFFHSRNLSCFHPLAVQELQACVATHGCNLLPPSVACMRILLKRFRLLFFHLLSTNYCYSVCIQRGQYQAFHVPLLFAISGIL